MFIVNHKYNGGVYQPEVVVVPPDVYVDVDDRVSDPAVVASLEGFAVDAFVASTRHMEIKKMFNKKRK